MQSLNYFVQVALSDESSVYEVGEQRQQLIAFQDELQVFVEALFVICSQSTDDDNIKERIAVKALRIGLISPDGPSCLQA